MNDNEIVVCSVCGKTHERGMGKYYLNSDGKAECKEHINAQKAKIVSVKQRDFNLPGFVTSYGLNAREQDLIWNTLDTWLDEFGTEHKLEGQTLDDLTRLRGSIQQMLSGLERGYEIYDAGDDPTAVAKGIFGRLFMRRPYSEEGANTPFLVFRLPQFAEEIVFNIPQVIQQLNLIVNPPKDAKEELTLKTE